MSTCLIVWLYKIGLTAYHRAQLRNPCPYSQRVLPQPQQHLTGHIKQPRPEPILYANTRKLHRIIIANHCCTVDPTLISSGRKYTKKQGMYVLPTPYCIWLMD